MVNRACSCSRWWISNGARGKCSRKLVWSNSSKSWTVTRLANVIPPRLVRVARASRNVKDTTPDFARQEKSPLAEGSAHEWLGGRGIGYAPRSQRTVVPPTYSVRRRGGKGGL